MASADRKAVFLDTNIFLHYQPFEQIPWPAVVKASQVLLVIPPIMVRELNKHMDIGIAQYNYNLKEFYKQYEAYIKYCSQYENIQLRTIKLNVSIVNEGTCPAENVDIRMHFPDGFELRNEDVSLEMSEPLPPAKPKKPIETLEKLLNQQESLYYRDIFPDQYFPNPYLRHEFPDASGPSIRKTNSYYEIYADNLPQAKSGQLHVRIEKEN